MKSNKFLILFFPLFALLGIAPALAQWGKMIVLLGAGIFLYALLAAPWSALQILLFLAPFYGFVRFTLGLSTTQVIIKDVAVIMIIISCFIWNIAIRRKKISFNRIDRLLLVFFVVVVFQFFRAPEPLLGLLGFKIIAAYIPVYLAVRWERPSVAKVKKTFGIVIGIIFLTTLYGFWQQFVGRAMLAELGLERTGTSIHITGPRDTNVFRLFSTYAGPEYFGAALVFSILLLVGLWPYYKKRFLKVIVVLMVIAMAIALSLTFVRIEWFMLILGLIFLATYSKDHKITFVVLFLAGVVLFLLPEAAKERAKFSFTSEDESYFARKEVYFQWNIPNILNNIMGRGLGTTSGQTVFSRLTQKTVTTGLIGGGTTESWYGSIAIELGIIGLLVYLWLMREIIKYCSEVFRKSQDKFLKWLSFGFSSFVVGMLVTNVVAPMPALFPAGDLYFWFVLGAIASIYEQELEKEKGLVYK